MSVDGFGIQFFMVWHSINKFSILYLYNIMHLKIGGNFCMKGFVQTERYYLPEPLTCFLLASLIALYHIFDVFDIVKVIYVKILYFF